MQEDVNLSLNEVSISSRRHPLWQGVLAIVLYIGSWVANAEALQGITNGSFCPWGIPPYDKPVFLTWLDYNLMMAGFFFVAPWIHRHYDGMSVLRFLDTVWRGQWTLRDMGLACTGLSFLLTSCHIFYMLGLRKISVASLNATYQLQAACTLSLSIWLLGGHFSRWQQWGILLSVVGILCIVVPPLWIQQERTETGNHNDDDNNGSGGSNPQETWDTIVGTMATVASALLWGLYQVAWKALHDSKLGGKVISPTAELVDTIVTLAVIGVANLTIGWIVLPIVDWVDFETFQLPPVSLSGVLTINAIIEYAFNAFIAIAIYMTSPIATSLTAPLTIPLSWITDRIIYGIGIGDATAGGWGWAGAALIVLGLYYMEFQSSSAATNTATRESTTLLSAPTNTNQSQQPYVMSVDGAFVSSDGRSIV